MADSSTPLAKEAAKWIAEAEADKNLHRNWHYDVYRHAMPWRRRPQTWTQVHDQDELFDSTAIDALNDFAADLQNEYTPTHKDWLTVETTQKLSPVEKAQIEPQLEAYQRIVFDEIRRSNFHEASLEAYSDFAAGTAGMCIQDLDINEPIHCQAIPIPDLLIVRGVYGGLDFRARCLKVRVGDLKTTYPRATFQQSLLAMAESSPGTAIDIKECLWRKRDVPGIERWQYVLLAGNEEAESAVYEGAGSCPILAPRWKTDTTTAWGIGPLYTTICDIKVLDQLAYLMLKQGNLAIDPVVQYPLDGVINPELGVTPGQWIPTGPDSEIKVIESQSKFDYGFFERATMQDNIRRSLFQDKPEQRGKTPPTLGQWYDERNDVRVRMGAPVGRLVTEWTWATFTRFAYLLTRRGILPEVKLNGDVVRLRAKSPLAKAQQQEEVVVAEKILQTSYNLLGPEQTALVIDGRQTLENIKKRADDTVVAVRDEATIQKMVAMGAQMAQASQGGAQEQ